MVEVNEKSIIGIALGDGIEEAMDKFIQVNKVEFGPNTKDQSALFYRDIENLIRDSKSLYDGEIEIFYLSPNTNFELLDTFLSLIKNETYHIGLRIIRKENVLYVFLDTVMNKNIYFVENLEERERIKNLMLARKK